MSYKLKEGAQSNYLIEVTVDADVLASSKKNVLTNYQKDISLPGFRKGHAPMAEVEKQMRPDYLEMAVYEQVITTNLRKIVEEEKDKQFIGSPYDIDFGEKGWEETKITFVLDVYPVVAVKDDSWKTVSLKKIDASVTQKDIDVAVYNFKKQYADYADAEEIAEGTVTRVNYDLLDKDGKKFDTTFLFVGDEEMAEHDGLKDMFRGKKKDDTFELAYNENKLPKILFYKKDKGTPATLQFTVGEVKKIVLPVFDTKKIAELFGADAKVTNEEEIVRMITESMQQEKVNGELMQQIEEMLQKIMKETLTISVPKTMMNEEVKQRMENMKERFGGAEKYEAYLKQMGEEKQKEMIQEISWAAKQSLEKFMVLRKFVELHELEVNWQVGMDAESKLYHKLTGEALWKSEFLASMDDTK